MAIDLIKDVFEPVAKRIQSECAIHSLREHLNKRYVGCKPTKQGGIEGWFTVQVILALGDRVKWMDLNKGPDLALRDDKSTVYLELKAATDLNTTDKNGSPREGVKKYCDKSKYQPFAGCLFLGDGSKGSKIKELSDSEVKLRDSRTFKSVDRTWIVGLLISIKN